MSLIPFDPLADEFLKEQAPLRIDIRVVQRNARKRITTISGLPANLDFEKVLKVLKKMLNCAGTTKEDDGIHIQLSGDQRLRVAGFLVEQKICTKSDIHLHGA